MDFCVLTPVLPKYYQCDYFTGIVELVKKLGNSSFEREDEEVNIVLIFSRCIKGFLSKRRNFNELNI